MQYKDYYQVLGLDRSASGAEIKRAYQRLARKYHPDVSKEAGSEARFKEINEAYHALKDPEKRKAYDELGSQWHAGQEFRPPPGWSFHVSGTGRPEQMDLGGFSDFFATLFGGGEPFGGFGGRARARPLRGQDLHADIELQLEEAFHGAQRPLALQVRDRDPRGQPRSGTRQLQVRVPRGVVEGQRIRLAGQGAPGPGGAPAGDLYLQVRFAPHRHFRAEGRDIYLELPVTPWEVALGARIGIPTLGGAVRLNVPAGSRAGTKLRLPGRGLPGRDGGAPAGDQYVVLVIETPPAQNEAARAFYRQMAQTLPFDPRKARGL